MRALVLAAMLGATALPAAARAATITVTTDADAVANDGACSLREAITAANGDTASGAAAGECPAGAGADTIRVPAGFFTITRSGYEDNNGSGDFDVLADVTISGAGRDATTISGGQHDRVFDNIGAKLRLEGMTITAGRAPDGTSGGDVSSSSSSGGAPYGNAGGNGGGIFNEGQLTLSQVRVTANAAGNGGNGGSAIGLEAASQGNGVNMTAGGGGAGGSGGGIFNTPSGTLTVVDSVISGNSAGAGGAGGVGSGGRGGAGTAAGNGGKGVGGAGGAGGDGGGIGGDGTVSIAGTTISGNAAGAAGAGGQGGGGSGGNSGGWLGGFGGEGDGGSGGIGGDGGGVQSNGAITILDSVIRDNAAGNGGAGAFGAGGHGGNAGGGSYLGGGGGLGFGGTSGSAGDGGGVAAGAALTVQRSSIVANHSGTGTIGGSGQGGAGGTGGAPNGNGGAGNNGAGANGGSGGAGAGIASGSGSASPVVLDTTIAGNVSGTAGRGGGGTGGAGGSASGSGTGGGGGSGQAGSGGNGGSGGALRAAAGATTRPRVTATDNTATAGGAAGTAAGGAPGGAAFAGGAGVNGVGGVLASGGTLTGSILANAGNCSSALADGGHNIVFGDATCPGTNADPQLAALADNGGPGQTRAPLPGSPARDAIPAGDAACASTDERGVPRPQLGGCDVGAYEVAPPGAATGDATGVGAAGATLTGTVDRHAQATTFHFDYGTTSGYGSATAETGGDGAVSAAVAGLPAGTLVHFRLVATNPDGTTTGADRTFTTAAAGGPGGGPGAGLSGSDAVAPVLSAVSLTRTRFAVGAAPTALVAAKRRAPRGTVVRFTLSEAARVRISIQRATSGRRSRRRCVRAAAKLRRARRCTRFVAVGALTRSARAGANRVAFSGRLGARALARGRYRAVLVATDAAGNRSKAVRRPFRVV